MLLQYSNGIWQEVGRGRKLLWTGKGKGKKNWQEKGEGKGKRKGQDDAKRRGQMEGIQRGGQFEMIGREGAKRGIQVFVKLIWGRS